MEIPPDLYRVAVVVLLGIIFILYARIQAHSQEEFKDLPENALATALGSSGMIGNKDAKPAGVDCSTKPSPGDTGALMMYNMACAEKKSTTSEMEEMLLNVGESEEGDSMVGGGGKGGLLSKLKRNKAARASQRQSERDKLEFECAEGALDSPEPNIAYGALRVVIKNKLSNYCRLSSRIVDRLAGGKKVLGNLSDAKAKNAVLKDLKKSGVKPQRCDILMNMPQYSDGAGRIFWALRKVGNSMMSDIRTELFFYYTKLKDLSSVANTLQNQNFDSINQDEYKQKADDEDNYKDAFEDYDGFQDKCYGIFDTGGKGGGGRGGGIEDILDDGSKEATDRSTPDGRLLRREVDRVRRIIQSPEFNNLQGFINTLNGQIDGLDEAQRKISERTDGPRKSYAKYSVKNPLEGLFAQMLELKNYSF